MGRLFFLLEHTAFEKSSGSVAMISVTAESTAALFMSSLDQKGASASKIFFGTPEWPELAVLMAIKNGCLREVQKEIRSQSHSHYRITFEALTQRVKVKNSQVEPDLPP